ncbi:Fanconi anemia group E protein [Lepisosteus oculatus]|uniref:Fanconi anemia group E protein n=1 Tax=Lepisosteus oculatus TaxID=7918 RepID=UPI003716D040
MDLESVLKRFDGRSRLLLQALSLGFCGARRAMQVYRRQRSSDTEGLHTWMESLVKDEAYLDGNCLAVKPLVCLFPVLFQRNLLSFLLLTHTVLPRPCLLRLLHCLSQEPSADPWVQALLSHLRRVLQLEDPHAAMSIHLSSECQEGLTLLCKRLAGGSSGDTSGAAAEQWPAWFRGKEVRQPPSAGMETLHPENQKKRKSESAGLSQGGSDCEESGSQSKKLRLVCPEAQEACEQPRGHSSEDGSALTEKPGLGEAFVPHDAEPGRAGAAVEPARGPDCTGPEDASAVVLPSHLRAFVPSIKELLEIETERCELDSPTALQVLNDCNPGEVELLCRELHLSEVPEQVLPQFCTRLLELSPDLSYSTAATLARHLFLSRILSLSEPASRFLVTAVTSFCSRYPRPSCCALIGPLLQAEQAGSAQMELLCRLLEDSLEQQYQVLVFEQTLTVPWSEDVLLVIHALLETKMELSGEMFDRFIEKLNQQAALFSKSMKFAKMMLAFLTKYQSHVAVTHKSTLAHCLALNETFLKKSLQAALKRISPG